MSAAIIAQADAGRGGGSPGPLGLSLGEGALVEGAESPGPQLRVVHPQLGLHVVHLAHGLDLRVVSPHRVAPLRMDVQVEVLQAAHDELAEELSIGGHVVHALAAHQEVVFVRPIELVGDGAEETVPIPLHRHHPALLPMQGAQVLVITVRDWGYLSRPGGVRRGEVFLHFVLG